MNSESSFRMTWQRGDASMCKLCGVGKLQHHYFASRRDFLKGTAAVGATTAGLSLFAARPAAADDDDAPEGAGRPGRRYIIRGGSVMSMDPKVGDFVRADVLVEGKKILAVGPNLGAGDAGVIDAHGRIVMPGFIDTHHHQFETVLRSFLADGVLINDGSGSTSGSTTYFEFILQKFAPVYRPQDVYINELFGGLSQLDDGVTTVHDVSQIHHTPQHSDAAIKALFDTGRRAAFGYFEGAGEGVTVNTPGYAYPQDATRIKNQFFSSSDQLVQNKAGSNNDIGIGSDNLFIHMTGMSDLGWQAVKDKGAQVSIAFPIEMNMRHGMPPILKMQKLGMEPSLSVDVECTLTADFFTQMRSCMNLQRMLVNQMILDSPDGNQNLPNPLDWGLPESAITVPPPFPYWPKPPAADIP